MTNVGRHWKIKDTSNMGHPAWNKGLVGFRKGIKFSDEHKKKIANSLKGNKNGVGHIVTKENREKMNKNRVMTDEIRNKISEAQKGKKKPPRTIEHCKHLSEMQLKKVREGKHKWYKGGITPLNRKIRTSLEYRLWRKSVFERDRWTCIWCGYKGSKIQADHIKRFSEFPELRFAIDNGRTLCVTCHQKTDNWGNQKK